jgi:hypothetical protein
MKVEITKKRIIKAIETEPALVPGLWVTYEGAAPANVGNTANCSVCAVGAVMRSCMEPTQSANFIDSAASAAIEVEDNLEAADTAELRSVQSFSETRKQIYARAKKQAENKLYMHSLSYVFEGLTDLKGREEFRARRFISKAAMRSVRRSLVSFVKKNFPNKVVIDIDGAKPAKDVKVVEG